MSGNHVPPRLARHIIERMGENGQPPERGALAVNVGTDELLEVLRREYLEPMREFGRNSSFKLVQAPFGGGKTHFLQCVRETSWEMGFVTAVVGVSPKECPFDDVEQIYREVARRLELPPGSLDEEFQPGVETVLRQIAEDRVERSGEAQFRSWLLDEFARSRVESLSLRRAALLFMEAVLDRNDEREELLAAYLRGERVGQRELSDLQIRELLDESNAFRFLRSLVQAFRALDVPGVVLLFDELDRVLSLSARRRRDIGDNLRQMIDHCGQATLPSLLWMYAVPPEFMTTIVPEYPALEQRLKGAAWFSSASPLQPIIDLDRIPLRAAELFERIGLRLLELYETAYNHPLDRSIQEENIRELAEQLGESQLESGTRRTFVKSVIHLLSAQRSEGQHRVTSGELRKLSGTGAAGELPPMEGEEDF